MATSGTSAFITTRNQIINHAARLCGALRQGESLGSAKIATFEYALNALVKDWQAKGLRVWTVAEGVLVPQLRQYNYDMGGASTDHVALADDFVLTALALDAVNGATSVTVDDASDIVANDNIGIVLSDGSVHWTTVVSKLANVITINAALTDTASDDAPVFAYTTKIMRPLKMVDVRRRHLRGDTVTPIYLSARLDFRMMSQPRSTGMISQAFYDKKLSTGRLTVWQMPNAVTDLIEFTFWRPIEDFTNAGDNPDLPPEWTLALGFNLAVVMAPEYGLGEKRYAMVVGQAQQYLDDVTGGDREDESIRFGVDFEGYGAR